MSEQGTLIPGEKSEHHANVQVSAEREQAYVDKAKELGWRPEEEWEGDAADWIPAKEFVGRQKLYDRINSLKTDLVAQRKSFENDMSVIRNYVQQMSDIEYKRALSDLTSQRKAAVADADVEAVETYDKQIDELKDARKAAPVQQNKPAAVSQEFTDWVGRNQWYAKDADLRDEADSLGIAYALKHKGQRSEQDVMEYVEKQIKKLYPEKFESRKPSAPSVEEGDNRGSVKKGSSFSERDLSDEERTVMNTFIKRGVLTKEEYLKQLAAAKAQ